MHTYLHIPKTGGTALKNALVHQRKAVRVTATHHTTLQQHNKVIFSVRDPLERWCSAYWERCTNPARRLLNSQAPAQYQRSGYQDLSPTERRLFEQYKTPDALLTEISRNPGWWQQQLKHSKPFRTLFAPLAYYLGDMQTFKRSEHRISYAVDQNSFTDFCDQVLHIQMPTDPFLARSRAQFDIPQSYEISEQNVKFFRKLYSADYALTEYIKTQPYYWENTHGTQSR